MTPQSSSPPILSVPCAGRLAYFPPETTDAALGRSCKPPNPHRGTHPQLRPGSHRPTRPGLPIRGLPDARFSPAACGTAASARQRANTRPTTTCLCFQNRGRMWWHRPPQSFVSPRGRPGQEEGGREDVVISATKHVNRALHRVVDKEKISNLPIRSSQARTAV